MLYFHHLCQLLLTPPLNGLFVLLVACLVLRKNLKFGLSSLLLGLAFLYIQTTPIFANLLARAIYPKYDHSFNPHNFKPEAIVVLGSGVDLGFNDFGDIEVYPVGSSIRNVESAAHLALEHPNLLLLFSGGNGNDGFSEAQAMLNYLQFHYSLANQIILENSSRDTDENAANTADLLQSRGIRTIFLVTQASHMWRSIALFHKYGIDSVAHPSWENYLIIVPNWWSNFLPNRMAIYQVDKLYHEIIGYLVYVIL